MFSAWLVPLILFRTGEGAKKAPYQFFTYNFFERKNYDSKFGVIDIVLTHKGRGEGSSQMRTIAYKGGGGFNVAYVRKKKRFFLDHKISKTFLFFVQEKLLARGENIESTYA